MKHKGKLHKKNDVWVVKKTEGDMEEYLLHPGNTNFVEALLFHKKFEVDEEITFNFGIDCLEKCNNVCNQCYGKKTYAFLMDTNFR